MKKILKSLIAILLAVLLGMAVVAAAVLILPSQFDQLYLAELSDKYARLRSFDTTGENKIVIVGGSSVAFGVNSQMIEENLGIPAVNFGLYGPLGTAIMMDLTRGHINEGDIVVLAPETDHQTMSLYFNGEAMWDASDSDYTMLFKVQSRDWGEMLGSFWTYAQQKLQFYRYGKPQPDGIYGHDSFNEYGDIDYLRDEHVSNDWFNPDVLVDLDTSIIDRDYIDHVNEYIDYCEKCGATVYFSWPPMNRLAIPQDLNGILEFATFVRENFHCPLISNITDYIMDAVYFYDTNYHMTDVGTIEHTARLIRDLQNVLGDGTPAEIIIPEALADKAVRNKLGAESSILAGDIISAAANVQGGDAAADSQAVDAETEPEPTPTPAPTPTPEPEIPGSSRDEALFTYEPFNEGLMISGVTDEGRTRSVLEVPWSSGGQKVIAIGSNAFAGCDSLKYIYIQSNISRIMQDAFDGAPLLTAIHIDNTAGGNILVPGVGLFDDVPARVRVYVPANSFGNFLADYFWGNYNDRIEKEP